jgi:tRNA (guanine37-N1)-methyltransferase
MRFDIITIFPDFFSGPLDYGIVRRARESGIVEIAVHDLRDFTHDRHRTVDDRPFGGGEGMVLKPEPLFEAVESLVGTNFSRPSTNKPAALKGGATQTLAAAKPVTGVILLSASGKLFRQAVAQRLAGLERMVLLCGRYEGVDERVAEHLATEEISIGDFVLSGGELPAALVVDAVTRLLPGALGNEASVVEESFSAADLGDGLRQQRGVLPAAPAAAEADRAASLLLDYPHYTRPAEFRGWKVPEILLSGNHEEIRRWRRQMALEKTRRNRPDLLAAT